MNPLMDRVDALAADVGRVRRRVEPDSSLAYLVDRIADHVEWLDVMLQPSAAELAAYVYPGDDEAVDAALEAVDRRAARVRHLLARKTA